MQNYTDILEALAQISKKLDNPKVENRSEDIKDLCAALAIAQAEMPVGGNNKTNPYFMRKYTDFAEVVQVSRPSLSKNGLSVIQQIVTNEDGQSILHTILCHASGQWIESKNRIVPPKNDIQTLFSYITSIKRIAYSALVGVTVYHEDDDGEEAMANARDIFARGVSTSKYNPKEESYETISKDQLDELEYELQGEIDLAESVMDRLAIQSLADMPKTKYSSSLIEIRRIKHARKLIKK